MNTFSKGNSNYRCKRVLASQGPKVMVIVRSELRFGFYQWQVRRFRLRVAEERDFGAPADAWVPVPPDQEDLSSQAAQEYSMLLKAIDTYDFDKVVGKFVVGTVYHAKTARRNIVARARNFKPLIEPQNAGEILAYMQKLEEEEQAYRSRVYRGQKGRNVQPQPSTQKPIPSELKAEEPPVKPYVAPGITEIHKRGVWIDENSGEIRTSSTGGSSGARIQGTGTEETREVDRNLKL